MKISRILILFVTVSLASVSHAVVYAQESAVSLVKTYRGIERIKTNQKVVALTFDDGPHYIYTKEILAILKAHNIKGTFFCIGENIKAYPGIVKQAYLDGNVIANHTYTHSWLTKLTNEQIDIGLIRTNKIIHDVIGECAVLFRPPYGACSARTAGAISDLGFVSIGWSDMTNDYDVQHTTANKIASDIIRYARPGAIIGMHDGGGNREKTVIALTIIIEKLQEMGYEFVTIPELIDIAAYIPKKSVSEIAEKPGS